MKIDSMAVVFMLFITIAESACKSFIAYWKLSDEALRN